MKSDIENFKWIFRIKGVGGIWGKCTCVQLIAINKELSNYKTTLLVRFILGKEKFKILVTSSQLYLVFRSINSIQRTEKNPNYFYCVPGLEVK